MKLTEQGKQALKWLIEGKHVEYRIDSVNICEDLEGNNVLSILCRDDVQFQIAKPKLKLVDMSKLPKGTMTNCEELVGGCDDFGYFLQEDSKYMQHVPWSNVRIAEQTEWTYWGGGECPVPDGLVVAVKHRHDGVSGDVAKQFRWNRLVKESDVIAYRILGLADGWSDDPSKAAK